MTPAIPTLNFLDVHHPQVGLMDQGGGLQRLAWLLLGQLVGRQLAQLIINQRQEPLGSVWVALLYRGQDAGHLGHKGRITTKDKAHKYSTSWAWSGLFF